MYAVLRIAGSSGISEKKRDILEMLNLDRKFSCVLVPEDESYEGMLGKVEGCVTWGEVNGEMEERMLEASDDRDVVHLSPPSGGFKKSTKKMYPKGEAGYRGDEINSLLERMV